MFTSSYFEYQTPKETPGRLFLSPMGKAGGRLEQKEYFWTLSPLLSIIQLHV